jgi:hypothetical protein
MEVLWLKKSIFLVQKKTWTHESASEVPNVIS